MTDRTKKEDEEENKQTKVQQLALANINFSYRILYMYSRSTTTCHEMSNGQKKFSVYVISMGALCNSFKVIHQ